MTESLKTSSKLSLLGLLTANLAFLYVVIQNDAIVAQDWSQVVAELGALLPAGFGLALIGILNAQLSSEAKACIVFMRWRSALPGSAAFTRYAQHDDRIDVGALERLYGPLPILPREQNALWYRLFKTVDADPSVLQAHRGYLFSRDYACLAVMMMVVLGVAGFVLIPSMKTAGIYLGLLLIQFLLSSRAARVHGRRLVTTVLALKAAGQ